MYYFNTLHHQCLYNVFQFEIKSNFKKNELAILYLAKNGKISAENKKENLF